MLLENLRFNFGEDSNEPEFARQLGQLCDVYCNDAFALAHRGMASTVGITRYVRPAVAGLGLARELMMIEAVLENLANCLMFKGRNSHCSSWLMAQRRSHGRLKPGRFFLQLMPRSPGTD